LPGHSYDGDDPDGFMLKGQIVDFIERYAAKFDPPVREGVTVTSVRKSGDRFHVTTNHGHWVADHVICATGCFHRPILPKGADLIPPHIKQIHSADYKRPSQVPEGATVIVGSGQSGVQLMEELVMEGRQVHLCLGNAPRSPRRYRGKDAVTWLEEMGYYKMTIAEHPDPSKAVSSTNHYLTGRDGGHAIDLRQFALDGVKLYGFVKQVDAGKFHVTQDVAAKLDAADRSYNGICKRIDDYIAANGIDAPPGEHYEPVWVPENEPEVLDFEANQITSIIWCIGFSPDYHMIKLPVFDERGFPVTRRGVSATPGFYFLGLPWMNTWGSSRFAAIAEDAAYVADHILENTTNTQDIGAMACASC
jgi:putative flavoprotein involved in K+ transport